VNPVGISKLLCNFETPIRPNVGKLQVTCQSLRDSLLQSKSELPNGQGRYSVMAHRNMVRVAPAPTRFTGWMSDGRKINGGELSVYWLAYQIQPQYVG
jgi:hypothetical protein